MNYDEITKITAERISDYMTEAVNTDSIAVAEMFHNAAWGVRTLWFELVTKIDMDMHKKNGYASYDLRRKIEMHGFAPIFPDTCYHLTHYWPAAADIPVASDNPVHYADAIRYNARTPLQGSLLPLTRLV